MEKPTKSEHRARRADAFENMLQTLVKSTVHTDLFDKLKYALHDLWINLRWKQRTRKMIDWDRLSPDYVSTRLPSDVATPLGSGLMPLELIFTITNYLEFADLCRFAGCCRMFHKLALIQLDMQEKMDMGMQMQVESNLITLTLRDPDFEYTTIKILKANCIPNKPGKRWLTNMLDFCEQIDIRNTCVMEVVPIEPTTDFPLTHGLNRYTDHITLRRGVDVVTVAILSEKLFVHFVWCVICKRIYGVGDMGLPIFHACPMCFGGDRITNALADEYIVRAAQIKLYSAIADQLRELTH